MQHLNLSRKQELQLGRQADVEQIVNLNARIKSLESQIVSLGLDHLRRNSVLAPKAESGIAFFTARH